MKFSPYDDTDSLIRCAKIVGLWFLAIALLPHGGIIWQLGFFDTCSTWLVQGVLAALDLSGLVQ